MGISIKAATIERMKRQSSKQAPQSASKQATKKDKAKNKQPFQVTRQALQAAVVFGVLILGAGVFLWWNVLYTDHQNTFEGVLHETLRTHSVTRVVQQEAGLQSLEQVSRLQFGEQAAVFGETVVRQSGEGTAAEVVTEEIGTPQRDYVRYASIDTQERDSDGEVLDFSDAVGVWGVSDVQEGVPEGGESFSEAVLGVIPFGKVSSTDRRELVDLALSTNAYDVDYQGVDEYTENGRLVYEYDVTLQPEPYVGYMQKVAEAVGLTQLRDVDPASFRNVQPITFTLRVDVFSRQINEIVFNVQQDRKETVRGYGILSQVDIPTDPISASELQQRIQAVQ